MPSSTRSRSRRGTNGPKETPEPLDNSNELPQLLLPPGPSLEETPPSEAAEVVEEPVEKVEVVEKPIKGKEFKSGKIFLSQQDIKLARKMSKSISEALGLNTRSRSYRV